MHSETIGKIAAALAKAQGEMAAAKKDKTNTFTKSRYATLASVQDAIRQALSNNELSYFQATQIGSGTSVEVLFTMLVHSSGEWYKTENIIPEIQPHKMLSPVQGYGILLTYLKRYQLSALVGVSVADEDNDGNREQPEQPQTKQQPHKYAKVDSVLSMLYYLDLDPEFNPEKPINEHFLKGLFKRELFEFPQTKKQWEYAYDIVKFRKSPEGEYCHSVMKSSSFYTGIMHVNETIVKLGMKIILNDVDAINSLTSALNDYAAEQEAKDV